MDREKEEIFARERTSSVQIEISPLSTTGTRRKLKASRSAHLVLLGREEGSGRKKEGKEISGGQKEHDLKRKEKR